MLVTSGAKLADSLKNIAGFFPRVSSHTHVWVWNLVADIEGGT